MFSSGSFPPSSFDTDLPLPKSCLSFAAQGFHGDGQLPQCCLCYNSPFQSLSIHWAEDTDIGWRGYSYPFRASDQEPSPLPLKSNRGNLVLWIASCQAAEKCRPGQGSHFPVTPLHCEGRIKHIHG